MKRKPPVHETLQPRSGRNAGVRKVALLIPLKAANAERLAAVLARAAELAKDRDPAVDEAALAEMGTDPTDWSVSAVRALTTSDR